MPDRDGHDEQVAAQPAQDQRAASDEAAAASASDAASAHAPDDAETQLLYSVEDRPLEVTEEVLTRDPEPADEVVEHATVDRNWLGVASFVTGALAVSVVAIVLGHLGLTAAKRGRADNRAFSVAGLILGYIGLALTVLGAWVLSVDPMSGGDADVRAQQDVSAVGAAAATLAIETGGLPVVEQVETGYRVGGETIASRLTGTPGLTMTGSTATDWCVSLAYEGGEQTAFHYLAASGMAPGPCPESP